MDPAVERVQPPAFEDGLGSRYTVDAGGESLEVLTVRQELASSPGFEFAVRERATRLSGFLRACYAHVRSVERVEAEAPALAIVSERIEGERLSRILATAHQYGVPLEIDAALCLVRQLAQAVSLLHEHVPDVSHGAVSPERLVVTPNARLVVTDHVFGAALAELELSRERYWKELRIAVPAGAGAPRLDRRADVTQVGAVALAAILGRPLGPEEYPAQVERLLQNLEATTPSGKEPLMAGLRSWLGKALQLDVHTSFASAIDAGLELERVLGESDYSAAPASLEAFLTRCRKARDEAPKAAPEPPRPSEAATVAPPVAPPPASVPPAPVSIPWPAPTANATPAPASFFKTSEPAKRPTSDDDDDAGGFPLFDAETPRSETAIARALATPASGRTAAEPPPSPRSAPSGAPRPVSMPGMGAGSADYPPALDAPSDRMSRAVPLPGRNVLSRNWLTAGAAVLIALTSGVTLATRHFLSPGTDPQKPGILTVTTSAPGVLVVVDGYTRGRTPLTTDVAPGEHTVELVTDGGRRKIPVTMAPGGTVSQFVEVGSTSNTGKVHVRTDPAGARVSVDGNYFGSSPITVDGLAPGVHSVQVGDERDAVTEKVTIEAGATAAVVVPLRGSRASTPGWIVVTAPADVQLFENQTLIGTSRNSRVMVPAGRHQLDLVNEALGYRSSQSVQVEPGMEAKLKPVWPKATVAFNALPWAEVRVDGERVGDTPLGSVSLAIGPHDVVFRHPELGERHQQIMVTLKEPLRLSVDLRKK